MASCTQIVLSGHKCQEKEVLTPISQVHGYCYYHGKIHDGLTTSAESLILLPEDDD
jgi:hypothetical protein